MYKNTKLHEMVSCDGKRQFNGWSEAQKFLKARHRPGKKKNIKALAVYKCTYGNHFHIGNNKLG